MNLADKVNAISRSKRLIKTKKMEIETLNKEVTRLQEELHLGLKEQGLRRITTDEATYCSSESPYYSFAESPNKKGLWEWFVKNYGEGVHGIYSVNAQKFNAIISDILHHEKNTENAKDLEDLLPKPTTRVKHHVVLTKNGGENV